MVGVILIVLAIFVAGPIALFIAGGVWSALSGWLLSEDADRRAETSAP